jgi:hypothetical protein
MHKSTIVQKWIAQLRSNAVVGGANQSCITFHSQGYVYGEEKPRCPLQRQFECSRLAWGGKDWCRPVTIHRATTVGLTHTRTEG